MTARVQSMIKEFERLSVDEQREAATEILRRSIDWDGSPLSDDDFAQLADSLFQELDRAETG